MTKFLNISTDTNLGGSSASDEVVSSQKALKTYIDAHSGGGGSVAIDNKSITNNSSNEIQTVGVIDQNATTTAIKTWTGATADLPSTRDSNTIYNITDDTNPTQALLEAIYPVGSIYIGTMAVCPLSALFGTWQLVAQDRVLQGAGTRGSVGSTLNESLPNIKGGWEDQSGGNNAVTKTGAFSGSTGSTYSYGWGTSGGSVCSIDFNAHNSNTTYQDDAPVQQDAYLVNIWQRSA